MLPSIFCVAAKFHITQTVRFMNSAPFVRSSDFLCYLLSASAVEVGIGAEVEILPSLSICRVLSEEGFVKGKNVRVEEMQVFYG